MRKPNFFIVGAPKCGTTSVANYLAEHPDVFMALGEPHFFGRDIVYGPRRPSEVEYLRMFSEAGGVRCLGDKSVFYLLSRVAAHEIKKFSPDAKIVAVIRNPVEMVYSLHGQYYTRSGRENIASFEHALDAEDDRRKGRRIPKRAGFAEALYYSEIALYTDQLKRYVQCFGRTKIHIIVYDDLEADPALTYRHLLRFLEVSQDFQPRFEIHNSAVCVRSHVLAKTLRSPTFAKAAKHVLPNGISDSVRSTRRTLLQWNRKHQSRPPLHPQVRRRLVNMFCDEVEQLSKFLGRDFTHWLSER